MEKLIDFSDPCLRTFLPVLLQDHTTGKNIIWATDPPPELGVGFADEITLEQLDKVHLVPRVQKRLEIGCMPMFLDCIADTISWNVWQMDGLKKTVPGTDIPCKIKDWKADKEILFKDVGEDE